MTSGEILAPLKWKYKGAAKDARRSGSIAEGMNQMRVDMPPIRAALVESVVLAEANPAQVSLLERACFGKRMQGNPPPSFFFGHARDSDGAGSNGRDEAKQVYQLTLEEGFFLYHVIQCLDIRRSPKESVQLDAESLWQMFQHHHTSFAYRYAVYHHLRKKNWVIRPGIQFGADFMAYRHHPCYVHSDFSVFVITKDNNPMHSWVDIHANTRLCTSVAKTLLLAYVNHKGEGLNLNSPSCLTELSVQTVRVKRWNAEKNRDSTAK